MYALDYGSFTVSHVILFRRLQLSGTQQTTAALPVVGTDGTGLQAAHLFLTRVRLSLCPIEPNASTIISHSPQKYLKFYFPTLIGSGRGDNSKWQPIRDSGVTNAPKGMTTFNPV